MRLRSITLRQFRNYRGLDVTVDPGVNLFIGLNGSGKTNLIEAVAVLTTGMSPRGGEMDSLVRWDEQGFYLRGEFAPASDRRDPFELEMKFKPGSARVVRQNGKDVIRVRDLIGLVPLVSFVPEDLALIKGEPVLRRRAVDMILAQTDKAYAADLKSYGDALKARNASLRQISEGRLSSDVLQSWDSAVILPGLRICEKRASFANEYSERVAAVHERVSGGKEKMELDYAPSFAGPWGDDAAERWRRLFIAMRPREIGAGMTLAGPHRDDFSFLLNGRAAKSFASEGQKRTGAVSFKLAEIPYVEERTGERPICLLDDVLSELDAERAAHLLDELGRTGQCFVTMTGFESWPSHRALPAAIFNVSEANVTRTSVRAPRDAALVEAGARG